MVLTLKYIQTLDTNPNKNLAFEEYMLGNVLEDECILYLWQNKHTIVIGKNQDAYKECKVVEFENDDGFLVRRPSGGGAVYHDLGNLNFTFITTAKNYDVDKQLQVLIHAVRAFGINAEKSGRNDVCVDGRKFSGNAFLKRGDKRYHHGTILMDVDMGKLSKYLNVSNEKLKSKGVDSVKSRVVNLKELNENITTEDMRAALVRAFCDVYGGEAVEIFESDMNAEAIQTLKSKYESREWRFPERIKTDYTIGKRFAWGEINLNCTITGARLTKAQVYSDAMDVDFALALEQILEDTEFNKKELVSKIDQLSDEYNEIKTDIKQLVNEQNL